MGDSTHNHTISPGNVKIKVILVDAYFGPRELLLQCLSILDHLGSLVRKRVHAHFHNVCLLASRSHLTDIGKNMHQVGMILPLKVDGMLTCNAHELVGDVPWETHDSRLDRFCSSAFISAAALLASLFTSENSC